MSGETRRAMFPGGYESVFDDHQDDDPFDSNLFDNDRDNDFRDLTAFTRSAGAVGVAIIEQPSSR